MLEDLKVWQSESADLLENGLLEKVDLHLITLLSQLAQAPADLVLLRALAVLTQALRQGNVRLSLNQPALSDFRNQMIAGSYTSLIGSPGDYLPLILDGDHLYVHRTHAAEVEVAYRLTQLRDRKPSAPLSADAEQIRSLQISTAITQVFDLSPLHTVQGKAMRFTEKQMRAVVVSLNTPLLAISGGPGTGKTSLCANLLRTHIRVFGSEKLRILLAAPTGRAAQRLTESLRNNLQSLQTAIPEDQNLAQVEATTLHRLLGYESGEGRFRRDENLPLEADLVVLDEVSMVDLFLFRALLRALPPTARLILLGDKDQLPSVDAGSILADLAPGNGNAADSESAAIPWITLAGSHRSEAGLLQTAEALLRNDFPMVQGTLQISTQGLINQDKGVVLLPFDRRTEKPAWEAVLTEWLQRHSPDYARLRVLQSMEFNIHNTSQATYLIDAMHPGKLLLDALFHQLGQGRILAVLRYGPLGVEGLNLWVAQKRMASMDTSPARYRNGDERMFFHGAPVLLQRNDPQRGMANGDIGIALRYRGNLWVALERGEGYVLFPLAVLPDPTLAFAITVHKSQGSEYDEVLVVTPDADHPLLTREVLYTALTRARKAAFILGPLAAVEKAMTRTTWRDSGLRSRLGTR